MGKAGHGGRGLVSAAGERPVESRICSEGVRCVCLAVPNSFLLVGRQVRMLRRLDPRVLTPGSIWLGKAFPVTDVLPFSLILAFVARAPPMYVSSHLHVLTRCVLLLVGLT